MPEPNPYTSSHYKSGKPPWGEDHPKVIKTQNNLATLYAFMGEYEKSVELHQRVLDAKAKTMGTDNTSFANTLHNLAATHLKAKSYQEAERLYNQALNIWKEKLGPDHPYVSTSYGHLSQLYGETGDFEKAHDCIVGSLNIDNQLIDQVVGFTSENQKLRYVSSNHWSLHYYLNLINTAFRHDSDKIKGALDIWLQRKGIILDVQARFHQAGLNDGNPESANMFQELYDVRAKLSKLTFSKPDTVDRIGYRKEKTLEDRKDQLEGQLSRVNKPLH